ncbi:MAG: hypothetical protein IPL86_12130 [Flavobacteriales bacterium]|nr:hypothetical protein [Flavobacteriales bacterium]
MDDTGLVQLTSIRNAFYSLVTPATGESPLTKVEAAIVARATLSNAEEIAQRAFLEWIKKRYKLILLGNPVRLRNLIKEVERNGWRPLLHKGKKLTAFGAEVEKIFDYKRTFSPTRLWLAQQLNIKTCPYCNAQYTLVVSGHVKKTVAKLQFDHFYPKKRYPYLSLSLYNLIPVCAICNLAKGEFPAALDTHYHPYHSALAASARFTVKWNKGNVLSTWPEMRDLKPGDIEVAFVPKYVDKQALVAAHDKLFDITGVYKRHTDVVQELLGKAVLYTGEYKDSLDTIKGLFPDRNTMMRYILGNYMEEERILDRPLAKFTQDIAMDLGLIDKR